MHGLDRGARGAVRGHQNDVADVDVLGGQALQDLDAVLVRHAQVDEQQIWLFDRHDTQDFAAALCLQGFVSLSPQQLYERTPNRRIVIGDEDAFGLDGTVPIGLARRAFSGCDHMRAFCSLLQTCTPSGSGRATQPRIPDGKPQYAINGGSAFRVPRSAC